MKAPWGRAQNNNTQVTVYSLRQSAKSQGHRWTYKFLEILAHVYFCDKNLSALFLNSSLGLCLLYDRGSIWFPITLFTPDVRSFWIILTTAVSWTVFQKQRFCFLNYSYLNTTKTTSSSKQMFFLHYFPVYWKKILAQSQNKKAIMMLTSTFKIIS